MANIRIFLLVRLLGGTTRTVMDSIIQTATPCYARMDTLVVHCGYPKNVIFRTVTIISRDFKQLIFSNSNMLSSTTLVPLDSVKS